MKVAIFQSDWLLQIHTLNLIDGFALTGWSVHVYFYNVDKSLVNGFQLAQADRVRLHEYSDCSSLVELSRSTAFLDWRWKDALRPRFNHKPSVSCILLEVLKIAKRSLTYLPTYLRWRIFGNINNMFSSGILHDAVDACRGERYDLVIGVEALGLILAERATRSSRRELAYYSLEIESHTLKPYLLGELQHRLEMKSLQKCQFTLIQDEMRWSILQASSKAFHVKPQFIPVSLRGKSSPIKTDYLFEELNIHKGKKILLSLGYVSCSRYFSELINASSDLPDDWVLVFHGPALDEEKEMISKALSSLEKRNVFWSSKLCDPSEIGAVVASATAGLALYSNHDANHALTAKSSEKIAYYAKACIPIISFDYPSYIRLFEECEWGVAIGSVKQLASAIRALDVDYERYASNAGEAFRLVYHFDRHFDRFHQNVLRALG